jgi:hypothetical protein
MNVIYQKDTALKPEIQKYGCLFLSLVYHSPLDIGARRANVLWGECVKRGIITGDLNDDGDVDDPDESVLRDHQGLLDLLAIPCAYDGIHHRPEEDVPAGAIAVGGFRWKFLHFVCIDQGKRVVYDPLKNSLSVANGKLDTMRFYFPDYEA